MALRILCSGLVLICFVTLWPKNQPSDKGREWLQRIFSCPDGEGHCLPEEEKVLSNRFWQFVKASNTLYMQAYTRTKEAQEKAEAAYKAQWATTYPLYTEEIWPFGRGNGGERKLRQVEISPLGGENYRVTIDYASSYRTVNRVRLIQDKGHFLIDYIKTDVIEFQVDKAGSRNLNFTQAWTWHYKKETPPIGKSDQVGKITVYYNPETRNWLMNRESYGFSGEMFRWIVSRPDGTYLYSISSPHFGEEDHLEALPADKLKSLLKNVSNPLKQTGVTAYFKIDGLPCDRCLSKEYIVNEGALMASTKVYIHQLPEHTFAPLYSLEHVFSGEPRLPYNFPKGLPKNGLIVKAKTVFPENKGIVSIQLVAVTDTLITLKLP